MSRNDPQMKLRLPLEIKNEIEEISRLTGRSMNAEIVRRLEWVLRGGKAYYDVDGPDYPDHLKVDRRIQSSIVPKFLYQETDFLDSDSSKEVVLSDDERALLDAWRDISEEDRGALRIALRNARIVSAQTEN